MTGCKQCGAAIGFRTDGKDDEQAANSAGA